MSDDKVDDLEETSSQAEDPISSNTNDPEAESITQVGQGKKPIPTWAIGLFVVVAVGILLIGMGDGDDEPTGEIAFTEDEYQVSNAPAPSRPPTAIPTAPIPIQPIVQTIDLNQGLSAEERQLLRAEEELRERRRSAPLVLVNKGAQPGTAAGLAASGGGVGGNGVSQIRASAEQRMAKLQADTLAALTDASSEINQAGIEGDIGSLTTPTVETVTARYVEDLNFKLLQGKVIPAVLETAMNSDLPGMVRSSVSESVYSEDGRYLLIAKGSRLVGEYRNNIQQGQERIFVIWSRLITPDGIDIRLDSPGTDSLGRAGLSGWIDSHFLERFGTSAMLSIIGGAAQTASENDNQRQVVSDSFSRSAEIALENSINIPPTMHKNLTWFIN